MDLQHVNVKVFVDGDLRLDLRRIIEVFHRWVANQPLGELLIDVADYRHVSAGPGIVLVGFEADYAFDNANHRPGLLYNRKAPIDGTNVDRFHQALAAASKACELLDAECRGQLKFDRREFELTINDRCLARNAAETFAACKGDLETFLRQLNHADAKIIYRGDPRSRFGVNIKLSRPLDPNSVAVR